MGKALAEFIKRFGRKPKDALEWLQWRFKFAQESKKGEVVQFPPEAITDWTKPRPTPDKNFIPMRADQYRDVFGKSPDLKKVKKTEAQIKKELEKQNKEAIKRLKDKMKDKDPEDLAGGGIAGMLGEPTYADENHRVPYKDGSKMSRRGFLKLAAGLATIPLVGKYFKWAKPLAKSSKVLTSVPIKNIDGMPLWFKPLVNKVIKEGKEIESGAERVITHKTKLPNSKTDVYVEQDLVSGDVSVQIGTGKHGWSSGQHGQPVSLQYTAPQHYPTHTEAAKIDAFRKPATSSDLGHFRGTQDLSNKKTKPEFWVEEAEFTGGHPENVKFEESAFEKFGEHGSNFDEVEMFATGKVKKVKPTKKKVQTEFESGKAEADADRWADEYEMQKNEGYFDEAEKDFYEGKASGGRVPSSGGLAGMLGE